MAEVSGDRSTDEEGNRRAKGKEPGDVGKARNRNGSSTLTQCVEPFALKSKATDPLHFSSFLFPLPSSPSTTPSPFAPLPPSPTMHIILALVLSVAFVYYTLRKKSLSSSGAAAAFCLAMLTFSSHLWTFTVSLLVFFFTSSRLTKFKADRKRQLEDGYVEGGQRDMWQVLANSLTAAIALVIYRVWFGNGELLCFENERAARALVWAYVGHYAACNGDTWSSELGILNTSPPYLITTFRPVPPGTNGGVSPLGLAASLAGGLVIGLSSAAVLATETACDGFAWGIVAVGIMSGVGGSLLDSFLGATVEQTLYSPNLGKVISSHSSPQGKVEVVSGMNLLSGNQINFVSSFVTAVVAGAVAWWTF